MKQFIKGEFILFMLFILGVIVLITTAGCRPKVSSDNGRVNVALLTNKDRTVNSWVVENCEYLVQKMQNEDQHIIHKGNCKNPIHTENWTKEQWKAKLGK
jgi:hypothetical protein